MPHTPISDERAGAAMLYSSGTTGHPKGVRFALDDEPPEAPHLLAEFLKARFGFGEDTVYLSPAPLYHAAPSPASQTSSSSAATASSSAS